MISQRAALALAMWLSATASATAAADWPIVAPGTSLTRIGNGKLPASLKAALVNQALICDDGWSDDGVVNSPAARFFSTSDGRNFAAVQCPNGDADVTVVIENTGEALVAQAFATLRDGKWLGTSRLDLANIDAAAGEVISEPDAGACGRNDKPARFSYKLRSEGFVLKKAETMDCAANSWAVTYQAP